MLIIVKSDSERKKNHVKTCWDLFLKAYQYLCSYILASALMAVNGQCQNLSILTKATLPTALGSVHHNTEVELGSTFFIPSEFLELPFPPSPLTLTDSDEMTGDQWALSSLEVAPGVTPRVPALFDLLSSACRATGLSDFLVGGKTRSPVQKFPCCL